MYSSLGGELFYSAVSLKKKPILRITSKNCYSFRMCNHYYLFFACFVGYEQTKKFRRNEV